MCAGGRSGLSWWMDGSGCPCPCPCPRTGGGTGAVVGESESRPASGSGRGRFGERRSLSRSISVGVCVRARRADDDGGDGAPGWVLKACCCGLRADGDVDVDADGGRRSGCGCGCGCECGSDGLRAAGCMALILLQGTICLREGMHRRNRFVCIASPASVSLTGEGGGGGTAMQHSPSVLYTRHRRHRLSLRGGGTKKQAETKKQKRVSMPPVHMIVMQKLN